MLAAVQMERFAVWPGSCVITETQICRRGALSSLQAEKHRLVVSRGSLRKLCNMSTGLQAFILGCLVTSQCQ